MNYFVEYVAVGGAATAGMANSNIYYTVAYQ
jgi:type 1 fimbria pilin